MSALASNDTAECAPTERAAFREVVEHVRRAAQQRAPLLRGIVALSQREVLDAGTLLESVRAESKEQVADLTAMNHRLIGGHGAAGPSLRGSMEQQEHAYASFARFCDGTAASLCEQATSARAAAQNAQKIVDVAQRVGQLGNTARMVALNARVESSRLGAAGAPFAVLAVEIRGITDTILGLSEEIEQLGAHLKQVIPRLADGATALVGSHREVGEDLKLRMREAASTQRAALDEVEATAQAGYERADRIVAKLHKVLQHLQFQDRIAQDVHAVVKQDAASLALVEDELRRVEEGATRSGSFSASAEQAERLSHAISEVDRATLSSDDDEELVQGDALFFG